jgi:hypothetical protein
VMGIDKRKGALQVFRICKGISNYNPYNKRNDKKQVI